MTIRDLHKNRKALPRGWRSIICKQTGFSKSYVGQVLNGVKSNESIELAIAELAQNYAEERQLKEAKIKGMLSGIGGSNE